MLTDFPHARPSAKKLTAEPRPTLRARAREGAQAALELALSNPVTSVLISLFGIWIVVSYAEYILEAGAEGANITTFGRALWWGIVTFLTVGYGDHYPVTTAGRILAGVLMLAGVLGTAVTTSKISSIFLEQVLREGRGAVNTSQLKNHFVVCGWKEEMHEILTHILDFNPGMSGSDLVLIAHLSPEMVGNLRDHPRLKGIHVIVGNYFEAVHLKRAAPERAAKVLILADRTPGTNGAMASMTEVDARTIMTAMTLSNLARGTLVTAEILDPKMDQYLKLAQVSEIIYSREYSRLLLGNAAGGTGISNIIFDLLDPKNPTLIATHPIAEACVGKTYGQYRVEFQDRLPGSVVIGILENTGNSHRIKELALRQAQKTPDMNRLLQNLRSVKELRCNHPIFNPSDDYVIPEGAMVIVVETRVARAGAQNPGVHLHAGQEDRAA